MKDKKKHIDLFEELIRTLPLKKCFSHEAMDDIVASVDKKFIPANKKTEQLFDELEDYYKSQKPSRKFPIVLWLLFTFIILIGVFVLVPKKETEPQPVEIMQDSAQIIEISKRIEIIKRTDSLINKTKKTQEQSQTIFITIDTIDLDHQELRDTALLNDSAFEKTIDTKTTFKEKADTLSSYQYGNCNLPQKYTFLFSTKSIIIKETYKDDLAEIASKIINCPNIATINIKVFYTRRFVFFSNKKLASERINNILKNLKRNEVTIKMLRKRQIEFVHIQKNEYTDSFEKVEILLEK